MSKYTNRYIMNYVLKNQYKTCVQFTDDVAPA